MEDRPSGLGDHYRSLDEGLIRTQADCFVQNSERLRARGFVPRMDADSRGWHDRIWLQRLRFAIIARDGQCNLLSPIVAGFEPKPRLQK